MNVKIVNVNNDKKKQQQEGDQAITTAMKTLTD